MKINPELIVNLIILTAFVILSLFSLLGKKKPEEKEEEVYIASKEEVERFLKERGIITPPTEEELELKEVTPEKPSPPETTVPPPKKEAIPSYLEYTYHPLRRPIHPTLTFSPEELRKIIIYTTILGPPRAMEEWEWK
ncbi:hypothetical protein J7K56_03615 [Candidatus Calescamantes bacterium]|nr:hypothetical protein [Candidatus Calescamantes bacterium]